MSSEIMYVVCLLAVALQLSAISTQNWSVLDLKKEELFSLVKDSLPADVNSKLSIGLWSACVSIVGNTDDMSGSVLGCIDLPVNRWKSFPTRSLNIVRFFSILGAILMFCGLFYLKSKKCSGTCLVVGGLCSLIATIVWYNNFLEVKVDLDEQNTATLQMRLCYSYYINLLAGLLALGVGINCLKNDKNSDTLEDSDSEESREESEPGSRDSDESREESEPRSRDSDDDFRFQY